MNLFWFRQPALYFEAVELLLLAVSFYIALWLTVMLTAAPTGYWKVLSILPGLLICGLFFHIVKTAALLRAISAVDTDVMLEVIEETEAAQQLSAELRAKVVGHLSSAGSDNYVELERLYKQIDLNNSNSLSRSEFSEFLSLLDISFSSKKWERIFKEIDRNYDNEISFQEFFLYLFPDHDLALSLELRRLKAISRRVATRANYFLLNLSPFGETPAALERTASGKVQTAARASTASTAALPALNAIRSALSGQRPSQLAAQSDDTSISNRDFSTPDARAFTLARLARRSSSGQGQQQQQPALVEEAGEE